MVFTQWESLALTRESRDLVHTARSQFNTMQSVERARRAVVDGESTSDVWEVMVESGYTAVGVPESMGGIGDVLDLVALLEEAGRGLVPASLSTSAAAAHLLVSAGMGDLDPITVRRVFGRATGVVENGRVTCGPVAIVDGVGADLVALCVTDGDQHHVVEIDLADSSVVLVPVARDLDPSRAAATVVLNGVLAQRHVQVARGLAAEALIAPRLCLGAELTGVAAGALDRTLLHVGQRQQFGQVLGRFQALKHLIADAYVAVEKARSLTLGAALAWRENPGDRRTQQLSLFAVGASSRAAHEVSALYVQVLGAMGVTAESDAHVFFRRSQHMTLVMESASTAMAMAAELERQDTGV